MMSLDERLDKAEEMIQKPSFRENKGLGNEVGYYIFDYPAEKELYIRERIEYIKKKSENSDDDFKVVVFDLYDIMIDILIKKGYLEKCYQFEKTKGFERVSKSISNMLRITSSDSLIVNHIRDNTPEKQSKVAIVSVLQNVFNEMQGFSGSNPFLADLERKLTEEGKYDLFKKKFEDSFGSTWEESRSDFDFIQDDVVEVLDGIGFMSVPRLAGHWYDRQIGIANTDCFIFSGIR